MPTYYQRVDLETETVYPGLKTPTTTSTVPNDQVWWPVIFEEITNKETQKHDYPILDLEQKVIKYGITDKTPTEVEQYHLDQIAEKTEKLWQAAYNTEFSQISGSAVAVLTKLVLAGNTKGLAVQAWIRSIWDLYYERKAELQSNWAMTPNLVYNVGKMPYSIPELIAEFDAL